MKRKKSLDTTKISREATVASCYFDAARQFAVPDFVKQLKMAYYHGYRDALLKERHPESEEASHE